MKKFTLIVLIVIFFSSFGFSQEKRGFNFGLYGSPGVSWLNSTTEKLNNDGLKLSFSYGLSTDIKVADFYSVSTGIESSHLGGKLTWNNGDTIYSSVYNLQYLNFPLTLKMQTNEVNYISFYGRFGGSLGFRVNAKEDRLIKFNSTTTTIEDLMIQSEIHLFRVCFIIGAGIEYTLSGNTKAVVGLTYANGLTDTFSNKNIDANLNTVSINLGIIF